MEVEVKIEEKYEKPKIVIYTNKLDTKISDLIENISNLEQKKLKMYKDEKMYIFRQEDIEDIYSEEGKVYARVENEIYVLKNRLYELETILDKKMFLRISNSEIINFNKVKNIDLKMLGTIALNFKSGNKSYASRRYIPKIKEFLEI